MSLSADNRQQELLLAGPRDVASPPVPKAASQAPVVLQFDHQQAEQFLQLLGKDPAQTRIRGFFEKHDPRKGDDRGRKGTYSRELVKTWIGEGRGIYVVINDGGDSKREITGCRAQFNEWDNQPREWQRTAWRELGMPQPTCQVDSRRNSIHTYWRLLQLISPQQFTSLQKRLVAYGKSDNLIDPSRVMRLPGCPRGDGNREMVQLIWEPTADGRPHQYDVHDLDARLPQLPSEPAASSAAAATAPKVQPSTNTRSGQDGDLPPRPLHQILDALKKIPPRVPGKSQPGESLYHDRDRPAALGFVHAVLDAGGDVDQAIGLLEAHHPQWPDVRQVVMSSDLSAWSAGSFWEHVKRNGGDASRPDLKRPQPTPPMEGEVFIPADSPSNSPEPAWPGQQGTAQQQKSPRQTTAEKLQQLARTASRLLADRVPFASRLPILRVDAQELGLSIRDQELQAMLTAARRQRIHGDTDVLGPGDVLEGTPAPWAWDGLILRGCLNLLVALPKQGKTALAVAMVAAWWRNEPDALGRLLIGPCPPVLIVGTDQGSRDWRRMLEPAGLVDQRGQIGGPIVGLAHAGKPLHLDSEGIDRIAAYAQQNPGLLVLIDSLHACIAPLGLREESPEVAMPVAELMEQLEPHGATVILIHHASKGRAGEGASSASRGSTALPALASQILKLGAASENPNDHRRILQTQGREGSPQSLVIRREGAAWELLGGIEELEREQTTEKTIEALSDLQHRALIGVCDHWEDNRERIGAPQLAVLLGQGGKNPSDVVLRALQALERRGLVQSMRLQRPGQGGKAYAFWPSAEAVTALARVRVGDSETQSDGSDGSDGPLTREDPERSEPSRIKPSDPNDPKDHPTEAPVRTRGKRSVGGADGSHPPTPFLLELVQAPPASPLNSSVDALKPGDQVELHNSDGTWRNGWHVADVVDSSIGTRYRIEAGNDFKVVGADQIRLCNGEAA